MLSIIRVGNMVIARLTSTDIHAIATTASLAASATHYVAQLVIVERTIEESFAGTTPVITPLAYALCNGVTTIILRGIRNG